MAENKKRVLKQKQQKPKLKQTERLAAAKGKARTPFKKFKSVSGKEFHPFKLPDNRVGRLMKKRGRIVPRYFKEAWQEISKVSWPNRRETTRLTIAVFIFAVIFTTIVAILDFGLDKLFREIIIN